MIVHPGRLAESLLMTGFEVYYHYSSGHAMSEEVLPTRDPCPKQRSPPINVHLKSFVKCSAPESSFHRPNK